MLWGSRRPSQAMAGRFPAWPLVLDGSLLLVVGGYALSAGQWFGGLLSGLGLASACVGMLDRSNQASAA